jgi:hypothetical protein
MTIHLSHYPISCSPFIGPRIHITFVEEIIIPHGRTSPSHLLGAIGPTRLGRPAWRRSHGVVQPPSRAKTNLEFFYLFVKGWSNHPPANPDQPRGWPATPCFFFFNFFLILLFFNSFLKIFNFFYIVPRVNL